ncbi:ion channel [Lacticaseibacillus saniviri]|uniref:Potassium ion channel protein n=2 Tax=Lacticaseibacillus saniviri TaxID=931533 RepID=A0A0R2MZ73_9LACO|nr:ion channel [Lacticaseibacillus saniviri]KRO18156.1 Potassium ion channel protein [Lacticaseibacillus saniviri JCM 17471 = DSM 24301]
MKRHLPKLTRYYNVVFALLAIISIALVILDYLNKISLAKAPYAEIDFGILIIFAVDYFTRFFRASNKWTFFTHNLLDLLAIIPFSAMFAFFRFGRAFRLVRLTKLLRLTHLVGIISIFQKKADKILHKGGLIYYLWLSAVLILVSAAVYSLTENVGYADALWWAVVTATTVGYGDISPHTVLGRIAAVVLMVNGIGIISALTSAITTYLADDTTTTSPIGIADELRKLKQLENDHILSHDEFIQQKQRLLHH